jgi:hypothetical protein
VASTLQQAVIDRLAQHIDFQTLVVGGVWNRPLLRNQNPEGEDPTPGSTPGAFDPDPPHRVRLSCVVLAPGENADPLGTEETYQAFPQVWFYCQQKASEKAKLDEAWQLAYTLLHKQQLPTANGTGCRVSVIGRLGKRDDPTLTDAVVDNMRLQGAGVWRRFP